MRRTRQKKQQQDVGQLRLLVPMSKHEQTLLDSFALTDIDGRAPSLSLTFVSVESGQQIYYSAEMTTEAASTLRDAVGNFLRKVRGDVFDSRLDIQEYQPSTLLEEHQVEYLDLAKFDNIASLLAPLGHPKQLPSASSNLNDLGLTYFVISVKKPDGTWMHFARSISRGSQPQRTRVGFVFELGEGFFNILRDPVVFLDPSDIDWMWVSNDLYVFEKSKFEEVFQPEDPEDATEELVRTISKRLPIANIDEFLAACRRDPRMARKIRNLQGSPCLELLSVARAKEAKVRYNLNVEFGIGTDGTEGLRYIPRYKWQYVKILADQYHTGQVRTHL